MNSYPNVLHFLSKKQFYSRTKMSHPPEKDGHGGIILVDSKLYFDRTSFYSANSTYSLSSLVDSSLKRRYDYLDRLRIRRDNKKSYSPYSPANGKGFLGWGRDKGGKKYLVP